LAHEKAEAPASAGSGVDAERDVGADKRRGVFRRPVVLFGLGAALVLLALAIALPVVLTKKNKNPSSASTSGGGGSPQGGGGGGSTPTVAITGADGSVVTTETGDKFTYHNQFGGFCESPLLSFYFLYNADLVR
jgi:hypothetical protein